MANGSDYTIRDWLLAPQGNWYQFQGQQPFGAQSQMQQMLRGDEYAPMEVRVDPAAEERYRQMMLSSRLGIGRQYGQAREQATEQYAGRGLGRAGLQGALAPLYQQEMGAVAQALGQIGQQKMAEEAQRAQAYMNFRRAQHMGMEQGLWGRTAQTAGEDWQSRLNEALRAWGEQRQEAQQGWGGADFLKGLAQLGFMVGGL